ncbi:Heterokaryon incompatibility protein s [Fusarium oxysporum f. sp. cubense]|uniref:Heterokaryon incompatibility protein s n=1 Tax=Fusarium oxysporum f. sp. cubense TaxID=61366 RepID=A0A559L3J3_FUSOC|nr:Heterokaryon incompatibility protein s [Fusarium oxysporum f. sp. cubense]
MIPSAPKHRAYHLDCSAMLALLRIVQPRDARGRTKKSWAPCCVCYRYRPKRKGYWKGVQKRYPKEMACGILAGHDSIVQSWSEKQSLVHEWLSVIKCEHPLIQVECCQISLHLTTPWRPLAVAGLAGLFTSCVEALDKIQSYRTFGTDSHVLNTRFKAARARFERWGPGVGIEQGQLKHAHHPALDDKAVSNAVAELLHIIVEAICDAGDVPQQGLSRAGPTDGPQHNARVEDEDVMGVMG